jgi:uroporphyrinogen decarboxylase
MTPRERVLKALRHEEPDRIPIALTSSGFTADDPSGKNALQQFLKNTGLKNYDEVLDRLHSDIIWIEPFKYLGADGIENPNNPYNGVLHGIESVEELEKVYWPSFDEIMELNVEEVRRKIEKIRQKGCAIMLYGVIDFYELAGDLRGKEQFWVDMLLNPSLAEAILDKFLDMALQRTKAVLEIFGKDIDIIGNCDDFGNQDNLQISPELFKRFIKPRYKKAIEFERRYTNAPVFHHTCGSISKIIPDLIEMGIDIINPVQVSARGMDIGYLKKEFGKDVCFYGGIDVQNICLHGTVEEIMSHVGRTFEVMGENGGYVLSPTHALTSDISPEKVLAIFDTAAACRY